MWIKGWIDFFRVIEDNICDQYSWYENFINR